MASQSNNGYRGVDTASRGQQSAGIYINDFNQLALSPSPKDVNLDSQPRAHGRIRLLPVMLLLALSLAGRSAHADNPVVTQMTYDAGNNVVSVTDPRGLVTTYTHDGLGQLWQQGSPDTGNTSFAYDSYGRRANMTRADNVQTTYAYDGVNRVTSISAGGLTQSFTYDTCTNGIGRLCSDGDASGATSYTYTPEGWTAGRGFSIGTTTYAIGYGHDSVGHVSTVSYPDGNQANYSYTNGVVSNVALTVGGTVVNGATSITYQPMSLGMASWTSSNGLSNTMSYDSDARLTGISATGVESLGFTYDNANRITQIANGINTTLTQNFGYDAMSRLVSVYSGADNESYQYDANGNRLAQTTSGGSFTLNISATSNQVAGVGGSTTAQYGYDAKGNTTTVSSVPTYTYDAFNRLNSAGGMTYYVNPEGQRLRKTGVAGTSYFAPDQGGRMLAENPGNGWIDYIWLNGRLIGRVSGGTVEAVHDDQVGRPEEMTDATQAVVWRAQNYPFTQKVTMANVVFNLGFPGQYYDAETGNWNNGFRDYNSVLGRYIESDPMGLGGGINTYTYAGNNPISNSDPHGLATWQIGMLYGGYDIGIGLNVGYFQAVAPCGKNRMMVVNGIVIAPGSDFGAKAGFVGFTTTMEDANPYAIADVFNGAFVTQGAQVVFGGGATYGAMRIGGASTTYGWGAAGGLSEGFGADFGFARVTSSYIVGLK